MPGAVSPARSVPLPMSPEPVPVEVVFADAPVEDLAPMIHRQRLVVEGLCPAPIDAPAICDYLTRLSDVCGMTTIMEPVTHECDRYGWSGWIHWADSGAHFYAWDQPVLFFSIDIYTCKPFDPAAAAEFTRDYFSATRITARQF